MKKITLHVNYFQSNFKQIYQYQLHFIKKRRVLDFVTTISRKKKNYARIPQNKPTHNPHHSAIVGCCPQQTDMAATGVLPFVRGIDLTKNDFKVKSFVIKLMLCFS